MARRWFVNLVLFLVVILLSLAVQRELARDRRVPRLTALDPDSIETVRLERTGKPTLLFQRDLGGGWDMEIPYELAADSSRIRTLLGIVETPVLRALPEDVDRNALGLAPASIRLVLDGLSLSIGDREPLNGHRYVAVGGRVFLIGDGFYPHLIAPPEAYVSPAPIPLDGSIQASLDGRVLPEEDSKTLMAVRAEEVRRMKDGDPLTGRLLQVQDAGGKRVIRFLIAEAGTRWIRLDHRLVYRVPDPPPWLGSQETPPRTEAAF